MGSQVVFQAETQAKIFTIELGPCSAKTFARPTPAAGSTLTTISPTYASCSRTAQTWTTARVVCRASRAATPRGAARRQVRATLDWACGNKISMYAVWEESLSSLLLNVVSTDYQILWLFSQFLIPNIVSYDYFFALSCGSHSHSTESSTRSVLRFD